MTSMERVLLTLSGEKQQRPPYALTLSLYGARLTNCPLEKYYTDSSCYIEGQKEAHRLFESDIVFAPFALTFEGAAFGCELKYFHESPPNIIKPAVRSAEQFLDIPLPNCQTNTHLSYVLNSVTGLSQLFNKTVPLCAIVTSPIDLPALVLGIDEWIATLIENTYLAKKIIDHAKKHFIAFANTLLSTGVTFLAVPMAFSHPKILYNALITEIAAPALASSFSEVNGPIVFHHGGNKIEAIHPALSSLPNVVAYAVDHRDSFTTFRSHVGEKPVVLGNLNGPTLNTGTDQYMNDKVISILKDRIHDPHYIFATSGADIPYKTDQSRIKKIAEIIREGAY
jgi:uroporphyrinogen decarboxylase